MNYLKKQDKKQLILKGIAKQEVLFSFITKLEKRTITKVGTQKDRVTKCLSQIAEKDSKIIEFQTSRKIFLKSEKVGY